MIFNPSPIWISWSCRRRCGDRGRRCWIVSPPRLWRPTIWTTCSDAVRPNLYTRQHEHVTHAGVEPISALTDVPVPLVKIMFEDDHEHLTALRDYVLQQAWSENYEIFFSDRTLLEVTRKGASKGAMVARLAQRLGISPAHIYCAGDENNDLSMLAMAAEGFAPANCAETVRNCGATIVADCDHDTLAEIIAILDKRY